MAAKKQTSLLAFFGAKAVQATAGANSSSSSSSVLAGTPPSAVSHKRKLPTTTTTTNLETEEETQSNAQPPQEPPRKIIRPTELKPAVKELIAGLKEPSWRRVLESQFTERYFIELAKFLETERKTKKIFPPQDEVFSQFNLCPFDDVRVVILGQDPYHGSGQAHGLAFSVHLGTATPPSLKNIFKELMDDPQIEFSKPDHGNLEKWARQGVLLLNAVLTVEAGKPNSHKDRGWERFTDAVIKAINDKKESVVFMLWGKYAQDKGKIINKRKHHVLVSAHPSPYSAHSFFGNKHFSIANKLLSQRTLTGEARTPIDWQLDPQEMEKQIQQRWRAEREEKWQCEEKERDDLLGSSVPDGEEK